MNRVKISREKCPRGKVYSEVERALSPIRSNPEVLRMKSLPQHGTTSTYDHCMNVAQQSLRIAKALHLKINERNLLYGAFLHDFYLYDWHEAKSLRKDGERRHGFTHPEKASENARELLGLDPEVSGVIETHMWPLTITKIPKTREAWIVCTADTVSAISETVKARVRLRNSPSHSL